MATIDFKQIANEMKEGLIYVEDEKIFFANNAACTMLAKTGDEIIGQPFVQAFCEYEENDAFNHIILDAIYDKNVPHEKVVTFYDGRKNLSLHMKMNFIKTADKAEGVIIVLDDISDIMKLRDDIISLEAVRELNAQLETRDQMLGLSRAQYKGTADTDKLTGLYNRDAAECIAIANLEQMLPDEKTAIFLVDIDNFKSINEDYGRQYGDQVLQKFAVQLKKLFRSSDCVGRFDNDEFIVVMTSFTDSAIVAKKAQQIADVAKGIGIEGTNIKVGVKSGISIAAESGQSYDELYEKSLRALKAAKESADVDFVIAD